MAMNSETPKPLSSILSFEDNEVNKKQVFFKNLIQRQFPGLQGIDDLVQETLIRIWSKQHLYDPGKSSFATWSSRICIYLCLDHLRKLKTKPTISWSGIEQANPFYFSSPDTIGLSALVHSLNAEEREVIDLAYYRGYTHQEIAEYTRIPLGTVKTRIIRGIKKLRYYFQETLN